MSLRDAQAKVWRLNFVRSLQRQLALLHDKFPVLLSRLRAAPDSVVPAEFAAVDDLPVDMLTSMLDFLQLQEYVLSLFSKAASCPAASGSLVRSQRAQQALLSRRTSLRPPCLRSPRLHGFPSGINIRPLPARRLGRGRCA